MLTDHVMCRQPLGMTYDLNATFVNFTLTSTEGNASDAGLYGPETWAASKIGDHTYVQVSFTPRCPNLICGNLIIETITQKGKLSPVFTKLTNYVAQMIYKPKSKLSNNYPSTLILWTIYEMSHTRWVFFNLHELSWDVGTIIGVRATFYTHVWRDALIN